MKGYAKRTMFVGNWCVSTKVVRGKTISDNVGMQLVQGNLYTIPPGREDLERHFDVIEPKVEKKSVKKLVKKLAGGIRGVRK